MHFLPATPPYEEDCSHSRKSKPHRSPSIASISDHSLIFQLNTNVCKVIGGGPPSVLFHLRQRVSHARTQHVHHPYRRRSSTPSLIHLPHRQSTSQPHTPPTSPISRPAALLYSPHTVGRPSKSKGPCQACQEASDGCMRKAYHWPFPSTQIFYDKGKPYVYLCNKCGLRYNKSGGSVCRHCRWVICKEEKRKALGYIDAMRDKYGHVTPDQEIENFSCHPKYWTCNKPWQVGWVFNPSS
ncbi:hypothetical protein INT47_009856 [Mucor saturninus]|uniref:Uncharacterized protein n=1 Tax=Mucor saturninus TaxID=64648 RepID=A0A8H7QYT3_9FUNG|nr:hypothetical protein INT47_009856 [Mucor saturninus]